MRRTCAGRFMDAMVRAALTAGLVFAIVGCSREDSALAKSGESEEPPKPRIQSAPVAATTATPTSARDREHFGQVLKDKFDVGRAVKWQESPDGPIFVKPSGRVAHAVVAVKNPDGTISRHCLSSAAEVDALMNRAAKGAEQ